MNPDIAPSSKHAAGANAAVFKALSHPLRGRIMYMLAEVEASASEISRELDEPLHNVAYHLREMAKVDPALIEVVGFAAGRRGGQMKIYRACARPVLEVDDWGRLPRLMREVNSVSVLKLLIGDMAEAVEAGTFDGDPGRTLLRIRGTVDRQGWEELEAVGAAYLEGIVAVLGQSADRMAKSNEDGVQIAAAALAFETPPSKRREDVR